MTRQTDLFGKDIVKPFFFMTLERINEKPCYFCGGYDSYREETKTDEKGKTKRKIPRSEPIEPGDFMQHETLHSENFGPLKIFECSKCHFLAIFRSHYTTTGDL